jgi:iron complex outermembrane recepter protein
MRKLLALLLPVLFLTLNVFAQGTVITGRVVDSKGQPMEGVSVQEKGTANGATTDKNGRYSLRVGNPKSKLVFSSVGFGEREVALNGQSGIDMTMDEAGSNMTGVEVVGTRSLKRSATETPVPVDIIPISKVMNQMGQVDLNQILQYAAPSFNSNRQSGADGADHVDPATLRGLGPDQTLVLINGKRRHQSALVNLFGSRGRGNTGTDLNTIPASAIERIEILRDGASAQYGSDAIAGVINIILKSNTNEVTANVTAGTYATGRGGDLDSDKGKILNNTTDGLLLNANINYGFKLKNNGFFNITGDILKRNKTFRPNFEPLYPDNFRKQFGDAAYTNGAVYFNSRMPLKDNTEFYSFGGVNYRATDAFAYTRSAESERNVLSIYPNGFDPQIQSKIRDLSLSTGIRTKFGGWNADFNVTTGSNRFNYEVDKTLNASLEGASPTHFDAGGFQLSQSTIGAHFTRAFNNVASGLNVAFGTEARSENYTIFAGELGSWKNYGPKVFSIDGTDTIFRPGGSQGFPGFQPADVVNERRSNIGAYADAELDVSKIWLLAAAVRVENYSDFGFTSNFKLATRFKAADFLIFRGSVSSGFRAPSLAQVYFSSTFTNVAAGKITDQVLAPNNSALANQLGIPKLKQETSTNLSFGFTAKPVKGLTLTVDGYSVRIKDRVVLTGLFGDDDPDIGFILKSLRVGAAQFFTNALNTRSNGWDIIATYGTKLGDGRLGLTVAANFNKMRLDNVKTSGQLVGKEDTYFGPREKAFLLASAPDHKITYGVDYKIKDFSANLRLTQFSGLELINFNDETQKFDPRLTTDLSFSYNVTRNVTVIIGGTNILDRYPSRQDPGYSETGGMWEAVQMGVGGAFFFGRIGLKF